MKLEVGQFARLKSGYIVKVLNVKDDWIETDTKFITRTFPKDFVKASYNIIDILEVGDYVNGYIVEEIKRGYDGKIWIDNSTRGYDDGGEYTIWKRNEDIKSVITHEQMEQMAYKVGE